MKKSLLLVVLLLGGCVAKTDIPKNVDSMYTSLFSERINAKFLSEEVENLIEEIINKNGKECFDSIQKFVLVNNTYAYIGIYYLIENNYKGFAEWLNENCGQLSDQSWIGLASQFGARDPKPVYTEMQIALFNCIYKMQDVAYRGFNLNLLRKTCGYQCAQLAMSKLPTETDSYIRTRLYVMLSRFNTPEFNSILKKMITSKIELDAVEYVSIFGFEEHNRYDFLPELKQLESDLKKEKDPAKIGLQKSLVEQLAKTIPVLEKKKLKCAPIGLPLDWPGDSE